MAFSLYHLLFLLSYQVANYTDAGTQKKERIELADFRNFYKIYREFGDPMGTNECTRTYNGTDEDVSFGTLQPLQNNIYFMVDDACVQNVLDEGVYLLYLKNPWFNSACTLFIRAPQNFRILMDFRSKELNCDRSSVKVIDGLKSFDSQKRVPYVLMADNSPPRRQKIVQENAKNDASREYNVCRMTSTNPRIESSFNVAQIVYRLEGEEPYFLVKVTFALTEPDCNAVLYGEIEGRYVLTNHAKSGNCSWLVAGAVIITIDDERLLQNEEVQHKVCSNQDSKLLIRSGSEGWSTASMPLSKIVCGKQKLPLRIVAPCKFTRLDLVTNNDELQYIKFDLQFASDYEKEPFSYYCF